MIRYVFALILFFALSEVEAVEIQRNVTITSTPLAPVEIFQDGELSIYLPAPDIASGVGVTLYPGEYTVRIVHAGYIPINYALVVSNEPINLHFTLELDLSGRWHLFEELDQGARVYDFFEIDNVTGVSIVVNNDETYIYYPETREYAAVLPSVLFPRLSSELTLTMNPALSSSPSYFYQNISQCEQFAIYATSDTYELSLIDLETMQTLPLNAHLTYLDDVQFSIYLRSGMEWSSDCHSVAIPHARDNFRTVTIVDIGDGLDDVHFTDLYTLLIQHNESGFETLDMITMDFSSQRIFFRNMIFDYWVYAFQSDVLIPLPDKLPLSALQSAHWISADKLVVVSRGVIYEITIPEMEVETFDLYPYLGSAAFGNLKLSSDMRFVLAFRKDYEGNYRYNAQPVVLELETIYSP